MTHFVIKNPQTSQILIILFFFINLRTDESQKDETSIRIMKNNKNKNYKKKIVLNIKKNKYVKLSQLFTHPGGGSTSAANKITSVFFRVLGTAYVASGTAATTIINTPVNAQVSGMGARGVALGDLFAFYRIVGFKATLRFHPGYSNSVPQIGNVSYYMGLTFEPSTGFTAPANISQLIDFPFFKWIQDDPSKEIVIKIGRKQLLSSMPYDWLKTTTTGVNDEDYIQFSWFIASNTYAASTGVGSVECIYEYHVEFRGDIDPALNPKEWNYLLSKKEEKKSIDYSFE